MRLALVLAAALFGLAASDESPAPLPQQTNYDVSVSYVSTDTTGIEVEVPQFDPAMGTLTKVETHIRGTIQQSAGIEHTGAGTESLSLDVDAECDMDLYRLTEHYDFNMAWDDWPSLDVQGPYDNVLDYRGTSGLDDTDTENENACSTAACWYEVDSSEHAAYTGTGTLTHYVDIDNMVQCETVTGPLGFSDYSTFSTMQAGARVTVRYTFTP